MNSKVTLHFLCGKMAAGKSTLAKELAQRHGAVLLEEDHFLAKLFPDEIKSISDYIKYSRRVKDALFSHIVALLLAGTSIVLDFPGNTRTQRSWFRQLLESANVAHELHFLDVADVICKKQLQQRSRGLPEGSAFTTEAEFDAITKYFEPPLEDEQFNVITHFNPGT